MYVSDRPLTFADLSRAVERSAGLGQVPADYMQQVLSEEQAYEYDPNLTTDQIAIAAQQAVQPSTVSIFGIQVSTSTLLVAGLAVGALVLFGSRR